MNYKHVWIVLITQIFNKRKLVQFLTKKKKKKKVNFKTYNVEWNLDQRQHNVTSWSNVDSMSCYIANGTARIFVH